MTKLGSRKLHICPTVTKMGSIIDHRRDYNGVEAPRGQRHIPRKKLTPVPPGFGFAFQNSSLYVKESKTISTPWIPDSRYQIPDSLSAELGARIPIVSGILDSFSCIPDSGFHKQKFPTFRNADSLKVMLHWRDDSQRRFLAQKIVVASRLV